MNFLVVPLKKSSSCDLFNPLKQLIATQYGASVAESCSSSLGEFATLRNSVCVKGDNYNPAVEKIAVYHDALDQLEGRLHLTTGSRIDFKWSDITGKSTKKESSLRFEAANVLFCYGAAHSQVGESCRPNCENSLQQALKSFKIASSTFNYLASDTSSGMKDPLPDMTSVALTFFSNLMFAQAYECVFCKAEKDEKKPGILARISSTLTTLYEECVSNCSSGAKNIIPKDWSGVLAMKKGLYEALTQYYQSKACGENKQYGEQLARLSWACELIKSVSRSSYFQRKNLVEQFKHEESVAIKDNDHIYHEKIPARTGLSLVQGVEVIKKSPLTFPLSGSTRDYFVDLLPFAVTEALNTAKGVRASLVDGEVCRLREASTKLNEIMASYNLPAALQVVGSGMIPDTLLSKAACIRRDGGADKLYEQLMSIPECVQRNKEIIAAEKASLDDEEKSDNNLRGQYGERWTRKPSNELTLAWRSDIQKCLSLLEQTTKTDASLIERFEKHKYHLELLSKPEDALIAAVRSEVNSSETNASGNNEALRSELNQLCDKLEVVKTERSEIMERLKVIDFPPDFAKKLLTHYREHGEIIDLDMPSDVLNEKMASVRESVRENLNKQDNLLSQLQVKADMFYGGSDSSTSKNKGLLTMLNLAADEYSALQEAVRDAMKFYAELTEICLNTQSKIEDFCAARTTEKNELMSDITANLSRVRVSDHQPLPKPCVPPARPEPSYNNHVNPAPSQPVPMPTPVGGMVNAQYHMPGQAWAPQGYPMMGPPAPYGMAPYPPMYSYYGGYAPMPMPPNPAYTPVPLLPHNMGSGTTGGNECQGQYLPGQPSTQP
uniref:BRO1 domain-containing protein n=1 Tax=Trichobilharzia regenti TaxID=157069 RepID=A0AA85KEK7_TRIRE|nr:unnamed protein product [Trichobilharzia regenti]